MMSLSSAILIPLFFLKGSVILSSLFILDHFVIFVVCIFPLVYFIVFSSQFNMAHNFDSLLYNSILGFVFTFLFFCFSSSNSLLFLFFMEAGVIFMILLVLNFSKDLDKISSASFMFILNILGSIPFMFFFFSWTGSMFGLDVYCTYLDSDFVFFCFSLILVSKLPVFLLHFWLTKAHVSASGSGSMILASLMLKIGSLGFFKFSLVFCSKVMKNFVPWSLSLSISACFLLSLIMIRFFDLKYLVACSSIVHMALIFPFFHIFNDISVLSSVLMMSGHGLISCFVFFLVTLLYEGNLSRSFDLNKMIESSSKVFSLFIFFFFLMNLGFPPMLSFICEVLFISVLSSFSFLGSFLFLLYLVLVGKVFISVVLGSLFGKKSSFSIMSEDTILSSFSLLYSFSFFFLLFLV